MSPSICLNMIVKNESHIITDTLEKLLLKIRVNYYVISDTGSTDNTSQKINSFFKEKDIPGEIHYDTWKNFGHNRSLALGYAQNKSDYILIFDADDYIIGEVDLSDLKEDAYMLKFGYGNCY